MPGSEREELKRLRRENRILREARGILSKAAAWCDCAAPAPNRRWVADLTYLPTWAGFLYHAVGRDAVSLKIVGWAMATHLRTARGLKARGQRHAVESAAFRRLVGGEGGIRTLGTGYPVRQISNIAPVREHRHLSKTP